MRKQITTNEFIIKANKVHDNRYDYSLVKYINSKEKVIIICKKHGKFKQTPSNHKKGRGCPSCKKDTIRNKLSLTTKDFIKKAKNIHGNKYDYKNIIYINSKIKLSIWCPIHGEFKQNSGNHLEGKGCPKCKGGVKLTKEDFIKSSIKIHGKKYIYSNIIYVNSKTKVNIICPTHGKFFQTPYSHISGKSGCPKCYIESKRMGKEEFIKRSKIIHNNKYSYKLVEYKNQRHKVKIICAKHGMFEQAPESHLLSLGCPNCTNSRGENAIRLFLTNRKINFISQMKFNDCKFKKILKFDFYLPKHNICIEFDGEQHYKSIEYFGGKEKLKITKQRDNVKNKFCIQNGIKLLRISYKDDLLKKLKSNIKNGNNNTKKTKLHRSRVR